MGVVGEHVVSKVIIVTYMHTHTGMVLATWFSVYTPRARPHGSAYTHLGLGYMVQRIHTSG